MTGDFYVEPWCMDCDNCREIAPANFMRDADLRRSIVFRQPETPEEKQLCAQALEDCPALAIVIRNGG